MVFVLRVWKTSATESSNLQATPTPDSRSANPPVVKALKLIGMAMPKECAIRVDLETRSSCCEFALMRLAIYAEISVTFDFQVFKQEHDLIPVITRKNFGGQSILAE